MANEIRLQSPKKEKRQSTWLAKGSSAAKLLIGQGWTVIETRGNEAVPPTEEASTPPLATTDTALSTMAVEAEPLDAMDFLKDEQRDALRQAGYRTRQSLHDATDDELRDVKGIGPGTLRNLRAALVAGE